MQYRANSDRSSRISGHRCIRLRRDGRLKSHRNVYEIQLIINVTLGILYDRPAAATSDKAAVARSSALSRARPTARRTLLFERSLINSICIRTARAVAAGRFRESYITTYNTVADPTVLLLLFVSFIKTYKPFFFYVSLTQNTTETQVHDNK